MQHPTLLRLLICLSLLTVAASRLHSAELLVNDFEDGSVDRVTVNIDNNNLGSSYTPRPFSLSAPGSPDSSKFAAQLHGVLGRSVAPWSWVQLKLRLNSAGTPVDCRAYKSLQFWAKGDGGTYSVAVARKAAADNSFHQMTFVAPATWTQIKLPLTSFMQTWGTKIPADFNDVTSIEFSPTQGGEPFSLSVDDIAFSSTEVTLKDDDYSDASWFSYQGINLEKRRGTALDMSRVLDAPAGKHGPIHVDGENFVFKDGTKIQFWGVNIAASTNFPTHSQADEIAEMLAQMGVNMTRHHHMDAAWTNLNMFGRSGNGQTVQFDSEAMDRFDYFINALQQRGIYQYLDFLVTRKAYAADGISLVNGVSTGYKIEGIFDPTLIKLQEQHIRKLLNHVNPYTKKKYADDPALCLTAVKNEDSLFYLMQKGEFAIEDPYYRQEFNTQFADWLHKKYATRAALATAWKISSNETAESNYGLRDAEHFSAKNIDAIIPFGDYEVPPPHASAQRSKDTYAFYYDLSLNYFKHMYQVIRESGSHLLITGSNHWTDRSIDLYLNSQFDYIDRHAYWAHPRGGWDFTDSTHDPRPMVKDSGLGFISSLARSRVAGIPYMISEWRTAAPNDYRADTQLLMGAQASFQNWNAIQFTLSHSNTDLSIKGDVGLSIFNIINDPNTMATWPAVSLMIHRHDLQRGTDTAITAIPLNKVFDPNFHAASQRPSALRQRIGLEFTAAESTKDSTSGTTNTTNTTPTPATRSVIHNSTGELITDQINGTFSVQSKRTQAFCGFPANKHIQLPDVQAQIDNPYAILIVSSLDDQAISQSKHLLVTSLGRSINTGMVRDANKNRLKTVGTAPVLIESITGSLQLQSSHKGAPQVSCLDHSGQVLKAADFSQDNGTLKINLHSSDQCSYYEITFP